MVQQVRALLLLCIVYSLISRGLVKLVDKIGTPVFYVPVFNIWPSCKGQCEMQDHGDRPFLSALIK